MNHNKKLLILFTSFMGLSIPIQPIHGTPVEKWYKLNNYQTLFIESEMKFNWHMAWNECALRNMSLIAVDSSEKNTALIKLLKDAFGKPINLWLGGHDIAEEGTFIWSATGKRFEFTNWYLSNPDNYGGVENCVHIWDHTDYEWNDTKCVHRFGFICEDRQMMMKWCVQ